MHFTTQDYGILNIHWPSTILLEHNMNSSKMSNCTIGNNDNALTCTIAMSYDFLLQASGGKATHKYCMSLDGTVTAVINGWYGSPLR